MSHYQIGILTGSLRKGSYSRAIAEVLAGLAPESLSIRFVDFSSLPLFNQDFDDVGPVPQTSVAFREEIAQLDGFLFITPEYNRGMPALLKNALDTASRPKGHNQWAGKPAGLIGVTPGAPGAFGACAQLRQIMAFLNLQLLQQPEVYIAKVNTLLDEQGRVTNESTAEFLKGYMQAFTRWVETVRQSR
ncbi:MAG: NAD(P)H-dependent oxidoreductase [Eubacteriales bacterium]|nr:NAD(P)H-dependent oxidoreductase [Eubacteriales bacterium]